MPLVIPGDFLGSAELTVAGPSSAVVGPFRNCKWLTIHACVSSYASGGGIFGLRFGTAGGAIDTGARYRHFNHPSGTTAAATWGTAVISSTTTAPGFILLADAAITTGRECWFHIMNRSGSTFHSAHWDTVNEGSATSHQKRIVGNGAYVSATAAQITSVQLVVSGGDLGAGSGIEVWGSRTP